jgi:hypothetical protein
MKSVNPQLRHAIIGGRSLIDLIRSVLEVRIGFVVEFVDSRAILETLLEEYFYGGSFKDDFYDQLAPYSIPTDMVRYAREEILTSIASQVRLAFGDIRPSNQYSFQMLSSDDVQVTETAPRTQFKKSSSPEVEHDYRH